MTDGTPAAETLRILAPVFERVQRAAELFQGLATHVEAATRHRSAVELPAAAELWQGIVAHIPGLTLIELTLALAIDTVVNEDVSRGPLLDYVTTVQTYGAALAEPADAPRERLQ